MPSDEVNQKKMFHFKKSRASSSLKCFNYDKMLNKLAKNTTKPKKKLKKERALTLSLDKNLARAHMQASLVISKPSEFNLKEFILSFMRNLNYFSLLGLTYYNNSAHASTKSSKRVNYPNQTLNDLNANFILFRKQFKRETFEKFNELNSCIKRRIPVFRRPHMADDLISNLTTTTSLHSKSECKKNFKYFKSIWASKTQKFKRIKLTKMFQDKMVENFLLKY